MTTCQSCHHDSLSHNTGVCRVMEMRSIDRGYEDYTAQGGCGCTALPLDMVCPTCAKPFVCGQASTHTQHDCWACYEAKKDEKDRDSFAPLVDALRQHGIPNVPDQPWNTGGNIMCLAIEMPHPSGFSPYIMFSDDAEWVGCGLYLDEDNASLSLDPTWGEEYGDERFDLGWATPGLADRVAAWVESIWPALTAWVATVTLEPRPWESQWHNDPQVIWTLPEERPALPVLPDTEITTIW